ncbi:DUF5412 family protein [Solibacillus silvestris]|uniref:DUF5412 family protein n=1 Tax=Solibacillus silvestris TaxID=76853 RepID=UPI003F7FA2E6
MRNYYSGIALFSSCLLFLIICYYLLMNTLWAFSSTTLIALAILFVLTFYIMLKEFKRLTRPKKVIAVIINTICFIFTALILVYFALKLLIISLGGAEHLLTSQSPNKQYTVDFYAFDAGAMGTFGIRAELDGPLGLKKHLYYERHAEQANVQWLSNEIVIINGHELNLKNGDTFGYKITK